MDNVYRPDFKFYSLKEIQEDIESFEGVKVVLTQEHNLKYFTLYSEHYEKPLSSEKCIDDLNKRVKEFITLHMLPDEFVFPSEDDVLLFEYHNDITTNTVGLRFVKGFAVYDEEIFATMNSMECKCNQVLIMIVPSRTILQFEKPAIKMN